MPSALVSPAPRSLPTQAAADFWDHAFAETDGFTRPAVLSLRQFGGTLFEVDELLELGSAMLAARDVGVNADGKLLREAELPERPPRTAAEFESFLGDLASLNGADSITYTRDYCLKYSNTVAMTVRAFMDGYVDRTGLPMPGINAVYIAGRYRATWIGLHNDFCSTFLVPVHGRKHMMFWEPEYLENAPHEKRPALNGVCYGHVDVSPYEPDALVLHAEPGEVLFIPERWWHYNFLPQAESSLALSIGVFRNGTVADSADAAIQTVLSMPGAQRQAQPYDRTPAGVVEDLAAVPLPEDLEQLVEAIRAALKVGIITTSTSNGVIAGSGPIRPEVPITDETVLAGKANARVVLINVGGSGLLVALGKVVRVSEYQALSSLVRRLASTDAFRLRECVAEGDDPSEAQKWASWLYVRGAADIVPDR